MDNVPEFSILNEFWKPNDSEVYVLILRKKYIWTKKLWVYSIVEVKQLYFGN